MPDAKRTVKIVTEQHIIPDEPPLEEGYPMRSWSIEIFLVDGNEDIPATIFEKVTYELHPSFGKRAKQIFKTPPFRIEEKGWGEFELKVVMTAVGKGGDHSVDHDLNFANERYEAKHVLTFRNPRPELLTALNESTTSGPPAENGARKPAEATKKRSKKEKNVDMEKLAEGLQKLGEDDLLQVVQMIHDHKSPETYTKNDVDNGEFHVDLYTLPDNLVKMLWDYTASKVDL